MSREDSARLTDPSETNGASRIEDLEAFGPPRPTTLAHIIQDDREAIEVARRLAKSFAQEAAVRDRERRLPVAELDAFSQSGLWGMTVPKAYGGAEVLICHGGQGDYHYLRGPTRRSGRFRKTIWPSSI